MIQNSLIKPLKSLVKEEFEVLKTIQDGEKRLVVTGWDMIDGHIGGLLPGDMIIFSALSGVGKSQTLYDITDNILDTVINEDAWNYVFLDYSFEMKTFNKILRYLAKDLNKKKSEILFSKFTDEEKQKVNAYYRSLQDDRRFICQEPISTSTFYSETKAFCEKNKDKAAIFVSVDHTLLFEGSDKKKVVDSLIESCNKLKLEFKNIYFIIISQLNRDMLGRINDRDNKAAPLQSDLFASSFIDHISSYNIAIANPYKLGINSYMKVNADRYDYLSEFFEGDVDSKNKVSFTARGNLFYHVLKARESDYAERDIFVRKMYSQPTYCETVNNDVPLF